MQNLLNHQLGPYHITALLGQGAMASVYKAYQPDLDRYIALKVLPLHYTTDPQFLGCFEQEAKALAKLQHPYILPIYDYGKAGGFPYIVMPWIRGGTLADLLRTGQPLPLGKISHFMSQISDALDYAHTHQVIHRDVKPSNVLIDERSNSLLTDFGIAKMLGNTTAYTTIGSIVGTPTYMSPEQGLGEPLDHRCDIYALGVMLFQMATGCVPFQADSPMAVILKHIQTPPPRPQSLNPKIPSALETVIDTALAKAPNDRYPTTLAFTQALSQALRALGPSAQPRQSSPETKTPPVKPTKRKIKRPAAQDTKDSQIRENQKASNLSEKKSSHSATPSLLSEDDVSTEDERPQSLTQLITRWQHSPEFLKCVTEWRILPAIPPTYTTWPQNLDARVIQAIQTQGIDQPYSHQAEAIEAALGGKHVVIVTATASGKTLSYNAPVLHALLNETKARALYLFPTKALAQDQVAIFNNLASGLTGRPKLQAATYDGDTPQATRRKLRDSTQVIITNPDMLHLGILPHHPRWRKFFINLHYIIIDELHTYRGIFGSHFANILRRLARICAFYGAAPRFICASATIANPAEHAKALLDLNEPNHLQVVDNSGAPRAKKHLIFYNPPILDEDLGLRRGVVVAANEIARKLLAAQAQTVIFARTRLTVEVLLTYLRDFAAQNGLNAETIRGYRGGYLPLDRREIETGLRQGKVQGVVATTALELGLDIGGLNACVLTGYPGTIASTWQQIGRAGRRSSDSIAVLVASQAPLDQFLMQHPDFFFDRTTEHARIDPNNPMIILGHLQAATYELPWQTHESFGSYQGSQILLDLLVEEGTLRRTKDGYHWFGQGFPSQDVDLRVANAHNVAITVKLEEGQVTETNKQTWITIGELDVHSAPYLIHPGAIYLHEGAAYQIMDLDLQGGRAEATPVNVGYYTRAVVETNIDILETAEESLTLPLYRHRGLVRATSQVTGYQQVRRYTHETIGYGHVDLPEQAFETSAYWLSLPDDLLEAIREAGVWVGSLDYGPSKLWQERREAARARDGYRCRLCGKPEARQRQHDVHHIRPLHEFLSEAYLNGPELSAVYKAAHALSNLITLCSPCHRRAELIGQTANAWGGLAHALANLGPLFVMCDPRDLGVSHTSRPAGDSLPTITLYDRTPMGLGLADQLYDLHDELLAAAHRLVGDCRCQHGCPACVGPPPSDGVDLRSETLVLLEVVDQHGGVQESK